MASDRPRCAIGTSSAGSSPTTARCAGAAPSRSAALRSASSDGLPTTRSPQPVSDLIIAVMARDVPIARPPSTAKNGVCEQLYSTAPPQTAWEAASSAGIVNSGNQPTSTASTDLSATGGITSRPASVSGSARPGPPSTMTRRYPSLVKARTALLAGVSIASSGTANPSSRNSLAKCAGVRLVPLVKTTHGTPCPATHRVTSSAPGSGRSPWLRRSPSTSVPSMSNTKPRTSRSRASASRPGGSRSLIATPPQLEPETGLVQHEPAHRWAGAELAQQPEQRLRLRVVVPFRRGGGDHRVHLLARHPEPQQQLLIGDPARQPPPQLGDGRGRRLGGQLAGPRPVQDAVKDPGLDRRRRLAEAAEHVPDHLVGYDLVPGAAEHVRQGLPHHHLRERRDHDRVAELGPDPAHLLEHRAELRLKPQLGQLPAGGGHDAPGHLVPTERRVVALRPSRGQRLRGGQLVEVPGHPGQQRVVHVHRVPELTEVRHDPLGV